MATKDLKLAIEPRSKTGTTGAQALRADGKIPAVIYGHGTAPEHVAIDAHVFEELLHHGGRTGMITLTRRSRQIGNRARARDCSAIRCRTKCCTRICCAFRPTKRSRRSVRS